MERTDSPTQKKPASPTLLSPREAAVVNGRTVRFSWEPAEHATAYTLQVAPTAAFDEVLLEEPFASATEAVVTDFFPTDHQTFFWRVLASNDAGECPGEHVESFIAATPDEADLHLGVPDEDESFGPLPELVRAAAHDVSDEIIAPEDRFEREKERGVAYEGISAGQIAAIAFTMMLVVAIAATIVFFWATKTAQVAKQEAVDAENYTTLREARSDARDKMENYRVIDEQEGVYQIPIDRAMDIVATERYGTSPEATNDTPQ